MSNIFELFVTGVYAFMMFLQDCDKRVLHRERCFYMCERDVRRN